MLLKTFDRELYERDLIANTREQVWEELRAEIREELLAEVREEVRTEVRENVLLEAKLTLIQNKLSKGKSVAEIADALEEDIDSIQKLIASLTDK